MKTKWIYIVLAVMIVFSLPGCGNNHKNAQHNDKTPSVVDTDPLHNSRNSLDYEGTYTGTMPCADCDGIYTEITLQGNNYTMRLVYQGAGNKNQNTFEQSGTYSWDNTGSIIVLDSDDNPQRYQVGENMLIALDQNGNMITGEFADMYILRKK